MTFFYNLKNIGPDKCYIVNIFCYDNCLWNELASFIILPVYECLPKDQA